VDKTVNALRTLLNLLYQEQARDWSPQRRGWSTRHSRRKISSKAQQVREREYWTPVRERELEEWLSASDELVVNFSREKKVLYLPPLEKDAEFVPILSLECNLDETRTSIILRVMLVRQEKVGKELHGIGFRLESPECENQPRDKNEDMGKKKINGRHDFYHAQLLRGFDWGPPVKNLTWLPCSQPSFPLLANCPITLIFSLLLTLYGKKYCWEFYTRHSLHLHDMKQYMEKLQPWINWKDWK